jgi:hypothetical protein
MNRFHSTEYRCCLTGIANALVAAKEQRMKDQTRKKIDVGTSGWNYNHWKNVFYPQKMRSSE